jgi:hypothetical protein
MKKKAAARGSKSASAAASTRALKSKFRRITAVLQGATEKQLASLLQQLVDGKRKIPPDIELSELEAGILIENLDAHVRERDQVAVCFVIWDQLPKP